jgi:hypothetical protein
MTDRVMVFDLHGNVLKDCSKGKARKLLKNKNAQRITYEGKFAIKLMKVVKGGN